MNELVRYFDKLLPGQDVEKAQSLIVIIGLMMLFSFIVKSVGSAERRKAEFRHKCIQKISIMTLEVQENEMGSDLNIETKKTLIECFSELFMYLESNRVEKFIKWQKLSVNELKKDLAEELDFLTTKNRDIIISTRKASVITEIIAHTDISGISLLINSLNYFLLGVVALLIFVGLYPIAQAENLGQIFGIIIVLLYFGLLAGYGLALIDMIKQERPKLTVIQWVGNISVLVIPFFVLTRITQYNPSGIVYLVFVCLHITGLAYFNSKINCTA